MLENDIVLSQTDPRPMYRQIMDQMKQLVAVGDWAPGQDIPSIRQLAVALEVSVITVKRAYLELEREGVIVTRQGKGSSVAPRPDLGTELRRQELHRLLAEARRIGRLLDLSPEDLAERLLAIEEETAEEPQ